MPALKNDPASPLFPVKMTVVNRTPGEWPCGALLLKTESWEMVDAFQWVELDSCWKPLLTVRFTPGGKWMGDKATKYFMSSYNV